MISLKKIYNTIKKYYHLKILKHRYYRYGSCAMCGCCCENIYVRHENKIIKTEDEFIEIKKQDDYDFYQYITPIDSDDFGLIFKCNKFDKSKKICTIHKNRPSICRNYPSEEIFKMGACLKDNCGYYFEPIEKFSEILEKISKKSKKDIKKFKKDLS